MVFDATKYLENVTVKDVVALMHCDWRGDYAADEIVYAVEGINNDVAALLEYCRATQGTRQAVGFECNIDGDEVLSWLARERPGVFDELMKQLAE